MGRAQEIYRLQCQEQYVKTDRMLVALMLLQWGLEVGLAAALTPLTWLGSHSHVHIHVLLAVFLGGALTLSTLALYLQSPGQKATRYWIAVAQMLHSGLLIHLTHGRIETHFHIFGSLAFLAFYRDWKVFVPATLTTTLDHLWRGWFLPQSVYGTSDPSWARSVEHFGWVLFEVAVLTYAILQSCREMQEISEHRAALEAVNTKVEAEVEQRTRELNASRADLEKQAEELIVARDQALESTKSKSQFLANMSHEIRTPMNGVIGMANLLSETPLGGEQQDFVNCIKTSADALITIINDILDFSKVEAGKMTLEPVEFNLRLALEDICEMFAHQAHAKHLELICWVQPEVPQVVSGDSGRIHQILANFIGNALKFTAQGEIVVSATVQSSAEDGCRLRLAVKDTGVGIPPEKIQRVLEPFMQADNSTSRRYGGTGLGLTISKQLAELMGGSLVVESEPGRGSTFAVDLLLPVVAASSAVAPPGMLHGLNVLIVDDHATNRLVLRQQLSHWGCCVHEATSGREALAMLASPGWEPKVILMDMMMPDMDGRETIEEIGRTLPRLAEIPKILLTSMGVDREEFAQLGVRAILTKPLRAAQLRSAILERLAAVPLAGTPLPQPKSNEAREVPQLGLRLLVAEDNAVNQKVICKMLDRIGCRHQTVANGLEALEALGRCTFDAILMDVQMPEMDGLEATAEIRRKEQVGGMRIPIIAMTANAMQGDRERFLAAGMDDYAAKPLRPDTVLEKLQHLAAVAS